eukprot:3932220-Rhodomonas_salina.1
MQSAFDGNGAIHYIGTARGTRAFQNPHDTGDVVASMSSFESYVGSAPRNLVSGCDCPQQNMTQNIMTQGISGSWVAVGLKSFKLAPNAYCLRNGTGHFHHAPRSWRLEGSEDGTEWTTLRVRI